MEPTPTDLCPIEPTTKTGLPSPSPPSGGPPPSNGKPCGYLPGPPADVLGRDPELPGFFPLEVGVDDEDELEDPDGSGA